MPRVAAITMARNDDFFLTRWISYYGEALGKENLYIYLDGTDQPVPKNASGVYVKHEERVAEHVINAEKRRLGFLSDVAAGLFKEGYEMVIGVDADEFLVVDPKLGLSLLDYLASLSIESSISGLGVDVGQNLKKEKTLDFNKPFLGQRSYALLSSRYTKPSLICKPLRWGSGFHRVRGKNFHIDPNLYLFHFGSVDLKMIEERFKDKDRMATGREGHIKKRAKTIDLVTQKSAKVGDRWYRLARKIQTYIRPIYALNKPSMLGWKLIVKIPDRFKGIV